ncbi:MAG: hypothetical protein JWM09_1264 [Francisellaceae bacterium]|nr:hypothetical protein [Francisellaceae bacterium]
MFKCLPCFSSHKDKTQTVHNFSVASSVTSIENISDAFTKAFNEGKYDLALHLEKYFGQAFTVEAVNTIIKEFEGNQKPKTPQVSPTPFNSVLPIPKHLVTLSNSEPENKNSSPESKSPSTVIMMPNGMDEVPDINIVSQIEFLSLLEDDQASLNEQSVKANIIPIGISFNIRVPSPTINEIKDSPSILMFMSELRNASIAKPLARKF